MIKNAIFLSCDARIALVFLVTQAVCHSEERGITLETPRRMPTIFVEFRV